MFCNLTQAKNQVSTPTWSRTLAEATGQIIAQGRDEKVAYIREKRGLYHLTDGDSCSRYEWAEFILRHTPSKNTTKEIKLTRAKSTDFKTPATRPAKTSLDTNSIKNSLGMHSPNWKTATKTLLDISEIPFTIFI
jgi:dTDP-4-dehydrorhamnose reductase